MKKGKALKIEMNVQFLDFRFIYFLIITPIGLIMRIFGKDFLSIKFSKQNSYWINKIKNIGPMNRQF